MKNSPLDDKILASQGRAAIAVLRQVAPAAIDAGRPADRVLAAILRGNRQWGSRDRQWLSESCFAFFRWWGVLRQEFAGELPRSDAEWARVLVRAWLLDAGSLPRPGEWLAGKFQVAPVAPEYRPSALLPAWVEAEAGGRFGALAEAFRSRPPIWLRTQLVTPEEVLAALRAAGLEPEQHPVIPTALKLAGARVNLYTLPAFRDGWFEIQDLASQCIGLAAAPQRGERWWDCCAGAGGKSLQLAELMQRSGSLVAGDIREWKLQELKLRARKSGFPNIRTRPWDGSPPRGKQLGGFDGVLVDAPCSCSGVWRRNPDGRWSLKPEELDELTALQRDILEKAALAVKPGGVLVYATCSVFPRENERVVEGFLAAGPDFQPEAFPHPLTGAAVDGMLQVLPQDGDCDGMFVARMRRRS